MLKSLIKYKIHEKNANKTSEKNEYKTKLKYIHLYCWSLIHTYAKWASVQQENE